MLNIFLILLFFKFSGYAGNLFSSGPYEKDDEETDQIYIFEFDLIKFIYTSNLI